MTGHIANSSSRVILAGLLGLVGACAADRTTAPESGTLVFQLDPASCARPDSAELFIDGTSMGKYWLAPGDQRAYTVTAGPHSVAASIQGIYVVAPYLLNVPTLGRTVFTVTCRSPAAVTAR